MHMPCVGTNSVFSIDVLVDFSSKRSEGFGSGGELFTLCVSGFDNVGNREFSCPKGKRTDQMSRKRSR